MTDITIQDLQKLLIHFSKTTYKAKDPDITSQGIMQTCLLLIQLDYTHSIIANNGGDLSTNYPSHLIILEREKPKISNTSDGSVSLPRTTETIYENIYDTNKLKEFIKNARAARCRARFPLPVILYKGRHVCRSGTLAGGPEIYGRLGLEYLCPGNDQQSGKEAVKNEEANNHESSITNGESITHEESMGYYSSFDFKQEQANESNSEISNKEPKLTYWQIIDNVRTQDIKLLKTFNVGTIIDLMVEKKKVKFGMNVTSSEKVDKEKRYVQFTLIALPYPGCEFFKELRENNYLAENLMFDWTQPHVDAQIDIPEDPVSTQLRVDWEQYQIWDLIKLTKNYLKLIIKYLSDSNNGLLIHCISGWDRTPLFISLLRLSLWADGAIHTSLNAYQILYYTIAYDWLLFGHCLEDRLHKGEEIFFFCFDFLKHIGDEEFSIVPRHPRTKYNVLRNDSDSQLDNIMFDNESVVEIGSVSSNLSLNSWCSGASQNSRDSQDNNPPSVFNCASTDSQDDCHSNGNVITWQYYSSQNKDGIAQGSRSPLPLNRTSPVAVPVPGRFRQRNESSSSAGSWQMISGTGSLRGSTTANAFFSDGSTTGHASQESSTTIIEDETCAPVQSRKDRLNRIRAIFYNVYSPTVGFRMKDNSESGGIGQLLGNFAEKVGFLTTQRTSL